MVTINGESQDVAGQKLLEYMVNAGFDTEKTVVEINLEIIPKDEREKVVLKDGDSVEILRFVGGG